MIKSFKIYESNEKHFKIGDTVIVVSSSVPLDKKFIGLIGTITGRLKNMENVYSVIFDKSYPGTHSNSGMDPSERTRNFYKYCLKLVDNDEERKSKKEKYKHIDPFEEEIW
jgi:hypothetical protein